MKTVAPTLALLLVAFGVYAQSGVTGVWQAEVPQAGPALWTVELKLDGTKLTGSVNQNSDPPVDIEEGRVEGTTVIFKVTVADPVDRSVTFMGKINGPEITFTRDVVVGPGGASGGIGIFGARAVREFTVNRLPDGQMPKRLRGAPFLQQITLFDRDGKVQRTIGAPGAYNYLSFSPDGKKLAVMWKRHIHVFDLSTGASRQITTGAARLLWGTVWSPDGRRLAYGTVRDSFGRIYASRADGVQDEKPIYQYPVVTAPNPTDWSLDGRYLAFVSGGVLYAAALVEGDGPGETISRAAIEVVRAQSRTFGPRFSPDGRFVSYMSDESDRNEIYVRPFDPSSSGSPPGAASQISTEGAAASLPWQRSGEALYYIAADGSLTEVNVTTTPQFKVRDRRRLFQLPHGVSQIAVSSDGQIFAAAVPQVPERKEITVALEILAKYAGTYAAQGGADRVVTLEGSLLKVRTGNNQEHVLRAQSEKDFFSKTSNEEFEFVKDDKEVITHVVVYSGDVAGTKATRK